MATPKLFATTLLAATTLAISAPASAHWKTNVVAHADLDLSTAKGQDRVKTGVKQPGKNVEESKTVRGRFRGAFVSSGLYTRRKKRMIGFHSSGRSFPPSR